MAGLTCYNSVWKNLFGSRFINLGIHGDCVEHALWHVKDIAFPPRLKNAVILRGKNNINKDSPHDTVQELIAIGLSFKNRFNNPNIVICGLLSRDGCFSINRVIIDETNYLLSFKCSANNFHFIDQSNRWTLNNGALDFLLFYLDGLNLVKKGYLELGILFWKQLIPLSLAQKSQAATRMQCAPQISIQIYETSLHCLVLYLFVIPSFW